jgi:hypothetical protein
MPRDRVGHLWCLHTQSVPRDRLRERRDLEPDAKRPSPCLPRRALEMHTRGEGTARRCAARPYNSRRQLLANAAIAALLSRLLVQAVDDKLGTIARQDVLFRRLVLTIGDAFFFFCPLCSKFLILGGDNRRLG